MLEGVAVVSAAVLLLLLQCLQVVRVGSWRGDLDPLRSPHSFPPCPLPNSESVLS